MQPGSGTDCPNPRESPRPPSVEMAGGGRAAPLSWPQDSSGGGQLFTPAAPGEADLRRVFRSQGFHR